MLHQILHGIKLRPRGDVVATVVKFADLVMLDVVSFVVVPITDGQRVSAWEKRGERPFTHEPQDVQMTGKCSEADGKAPQRQL